MKFIYVITFFICGFNSLIYCQTADDYFDRGVKKVELENYAGAIVEFTKAIELNPEFFAAYYLRAEAKNKLKDFRGAILDFDNALLFRPNDIDISLAIVYLDRGFAKVNIKDLIGAEEDFTLSISNNPKYGEAFINRGIVRIMLLKKEEACFDFSKAGELGISEVYKLIQENCK